MLEIVWAILNIALLIYFFIVCIKAVRITRRKLGIFAAFVLAFGLLSFMTADKSFYTAESRQFNLQTEPIPAEQGFFYRQVLDKTWTTQVTLQIKYVKKNGKVDLLNAQTTRSGLVMGIDWEPVTVSVKKHGEGYTYVVIGNIEWRILGVQVYSQHKKYTGSIKLFQNKK